MIALLVSACATSRAVHTDKSVEFRVESVETVDSSRVESLVVMDTLREVTTVTVDRNEVGDTLRVTTVTDRTRAREKSDVRSRTVDVRTRVDTVYVAVRDSVSSFAFQNPVSLNTKLSTLNSLKWIFWIIVALTVLIIILKFRRI